VLVCGTVSVPANEVAFGAPDGGGLVGAPLITVVAYPDAGNPRMAVGVANDAVHTFQASSVYSPGTGYFAGGVNALSDATAQVSTQAAAAPTVGQVLTATTATTADWETPTPQLSCPSGQFASGPGDGGVPVCVRASVTQSISGYFAGDSAASTEFARSYALMVGSPFSIACSTVTQGTTVGGITDGGTGVIFVDFAVNGTVICEVNMPCTTVNTSDAWQLCPLAYPDAGPGYAIGNKLDLEIKKTGGSCSVSPALNCQADSSGTPILF